MVFPRPTVRRKPRARTPSQARTPCPFPLPKAVTGGAGRVLVRRGVPARRGGQGSQLEGGRGPGSWCSSACKGSRSEGIPRTGCHPRAGTPRIFPYGKTQGKKKHININKFPGLSRVWVGGKNLFTCFICLCVCVFFFRVIPNGGDKTHKQNPPPQKIPG